jgi:hypothetical protein
MYMYCEEIYYYVCLQGNLVLEDLVPDGSSPPRQGESEPGADGAEEALALR